MILVSDKLVLYIAFKIPKSLTSELYDFSSDKTNIRELNTAIEESTYIVSRMGTSIVRVDLQKDIESKNMEKFLFRVKKDEKFNYLIENPSFLNFYDYNTEGLNNILWRTINSNEDDSKEKIFINDDYFISINDIFKFGNVKYLVTEMSPNLNNGQKNIIKLNIDFCQNIKTYLSGESEDEKGILIKCDICNISKCDEKNPIIKFCQCCYIHYECLKDMIKRNTYIKENEKVRNYYINNLKCKKCDFIFPLSFKLSDRKFELINIEKPSDKNTKYIILESIERKIFYGYMKLIHVIKIKNDNEIINIGRNKKTNDVIVCDPSVSRHHAQLIYKKEENKILLKNLSYKFGTLALIKGGINVENKSIQIQTGKILFEAQKMKFGEFEKNKKNNRTKYPLPSKY